VTGATIRFKRAFSFSSYFNRITSSGHIGALKHLEPGSGSHCLSLFGVDLHKHGLRCQAGVDDHWQQAQNWEHFGDLFT
jgi:hypothetical protein